MHFGKSIFAKKLLSLLVLITIVYPVFQPPIARGFSFFGFFGTSEEKEDISIQHSKNSSKIKQDRLIAVLVEEQLIEDTILASVIDRYAVDGAAAIGGRSIVIPIPENASVKEIYEGLAHLYFMGDENDAKSKLVGTVLIGNIPIPVVEKLGNLWPTIFPYTDFEKRVYLWNKEKDRFVFENASSMEPEIWHGVIRSQKDNIKSQSDEILKYLEENHKVHKGETSFADNLLYVNTANEKSVPSFLEEKYNRWLLYAEDIAYMRFNKTLLEDIESAKLGNQSNPVDMKSITELMKSAGVSKEIAEGVLSGKTKTMPDILTEMIIPQLADNYLSSNNAQEKLLENMIGKTGAWKDGFDTTMKLVAEKDIESLGKLKEVNDLIENYLYEQIKKSNIAGDITIPHTIEFENPITKIFLKKPLYWNGINRKDLTAKDCTLYRGSTTTESNPYAQKVEANRTLNLETMGSCANKNAIDSVKYMDKYEGCCAENIKDNGISTTYDYCDTGSQWYYGRISDDEYDHQGAELPVFDLGGTQLGEGPDGAFGCDELLTKDNEDSDKMKRFDSLVLHIEPTQETIDKQKETLAQFLPVDDPRGFSFYDYQNKFYRFDFLNIFDLQGKISSKEQLKEEIKKQLENKLNKLNSIIETASKKSEILYNQYKEIKYPAAMFQIPVGHEGKCNYSILPRQIDKFTKKIIWNESCKYHEIQEDSTTTPPEIIKENKIIKFYEYGTVIPNSFVDQLINKIDIDKLYSSFNWLESTLNEKNQKVLEYALGDISDFDSFLNYDFNGYQLAHITTSISDGETLPIDFKIATNEFDKDFYVKKVESILSNIDRDKLFRAKQRHKVDLSNEYLTSSLQRIFVSKNDLKPIPVIFSLKDKYGKIDTDNYTTEVVLNFSSSEIDQFFDIFPDKKLKVTAGKAAFFLKPKKQNFGGKLTLQGYVPQTELLTEEIPVMVTRYDTLMKTSKHDLVVTDQEGALLTFYIYDATGKTTKKFDGKYLKFISENGTFQGGINNVEIQDGKAEIRFLPGRRAGMAIITAIDEEMNLPDSKIEINIKSGEPRYLSFKNTSKFLLPTSDYQDIIVQLTDRYDNNISTTSQELSWRIENGEIKNKAEKDGNPRKKGVQEWLHTGESLLSIRPINKTQDKVRLSVASSILPKDAAISKEFTVIKDPILKTRITKKAVSVDSSKPVKIKLKAQTKNGELINHDFKVNVSVTPLDFLEYKKELIMKSGSGEFEFYPGTKAGKYTIIFSIDGFENATVDIEVLAGAGKKLQMTTTKKTWDKDIKSIPVDILMFDNFGNRVRSNEKISLSVSEKTKELIGVPVSELFLRNGKTTVGVKTKGKSGEAHLIVEGNNVSSDSLKLSIEGQLSVDDISKKFNPNVKFMILSGPVGGNLFLEKNVATALLFAGKTQAVSTMGVKYEDVALGYGFVGQNGNVSELLTTKFIFEQNLPEVLLLSKDKVIAKVRMVYRDNPNIYKGDIKDSNGIYVNLEKENFKFLDKNLYYEDQILFSFTKKGGIKLISGDIDLEIIDNNLTKWNIKKNNEVIGTITYKLPHEIFAKDNYFKDDFQGLWLKSINADMDFDSIFTGNSTLGEKGFSIKDKSKISSIEKRLGSSKNSIENTQTDSDIIWKNSNWRPATLFAGGNNIGISTQRGGTDVALLLGDPTLSRRKDISITDDETVGISLWKSLNGDIKNISYSDINEDGNLDLVLQINNEMVGLYQTTEGTGDFVEETIISEVNDGIKSMGSLSSTTSDITSKKGIAGFVQINLNGDFILHQNQDGSVVRKKIPFGQKFEKIKTANLNGDMYTDIVGIDKNQKLWRILGEKDGFGKPKLLEDLSPTFDKVDEKNTDKNTKYLSGIKLNYTTKEGLIDTQNLADSTLTSTLKIDSDDAKLRIGGKLSTKLIIRSPIDIDEISIKIPAYKNIEFEINSLNCLSCEDRPNVKIDQKTGGMIIDKMTLDAESKLILTWKSKIKSLPTTEFFIGDFENGKDTLDDISIPWNFGGRDKVLNFLSSKQQTQGYNRLIASLTNLNLDFSNLEINDSTKELLSEENNIMDSSIEDLEKLLSKKTSFPSISSLFDNVNVDSTKPSKDFLDMAAGIKMNDTMPIARPKGMSGGKPIIINGNRIYIVPTTTGKTAVASCVGLKEIFMISPIWIPNCTVKILDYQNPLSSITVINDKSLPGTFSLETQATPNKNLFAVDIVTQWLKDQWRELTYNMHRALPRISFNPPDLTKSPSNDKFNTEINKYELLQKELLKSKFINIQKIPVVISILDLDKLSEVAAVDVHVDIDLSTIKEKLKDLDQRPKIMADIRAQINDYEKEQKENLEEQLNAKVDEFSTDYEELKNKLLSLREKNIELLEYAIELSDELTNYFESWISKNNEKIDEWKLSASIWSSLSNTLRDITIEFFIAFEKKNATLAIDRGTWLPWLYETLSETTSIPITKVTPYPDTILNTTEVTFGTDIKIADVELKKADIDLHELVDLFVSVPLEESAISLSGNRVSINFPTANLPKVEFPELPTIIIPETNVFKGIYDNLDDQLKILPSPPSITKPLNELTTNIKNVMTGLKEQEELFGKLRKGVAQVPEWGLKAYIEQLTNEIPLDTFFTGTLDPPPINKIIPDKEIIEKNYERKQIDFYKFLDDFLTQNQSFNRVSLHDKFENDNNEIKDLHKNLVYENNILKKLATKSSNEFFADKEIEKIFMKESKYFAANDISDSVQDTTKNLNNEDYTNNIKNNISGEVFTLIKDIDGDGVEEIFYTNEDELFVKYNSIRTHENIQSKKLNKWTYDEFKSKKEVTLGMEVNNRGVSFTPFDENISYYELFFSERPDSLFEMALLPSKRKSKVWKRYALAKQNLFKNYKISKIPARVIKIKGSPEINMVKPKELMTYSEEKCKNPDVKKSFFSSHTILMATEDDTRLSIRVPAIAFKPAEYQLIRLEKGESTSIDYGKVCVFSGKLESANLSDDKELFDVKVGQMITSDMELYMNQNDFVQFQTSGNSLVSIFDRDEYKLRFFDGEEQEISLMLDENDLVQNLYGFLIGFIDEQKTLVRRKIFFNAID